MPIDPARPGYFVPLMKDGEQVEESSLTHPPAAAAAPAPAPPQDDDED